MWYVVEKMLHLLSDNDGAINMMNVAKHFGQVHLFVVHDVDEADVVHGVDKVEVVSGVDEVEIIHVMDEVEVLYICDALHVDVGSHYEEVVVGLVDEVEGQCQEVEGLVTKWRVQVEKWKVWEDPKEDYQKDLRKIEGWKNES